MGFADEARAHVRATGPGCSVGRLLDGLPDDEHDDVTAALADGSLSAAAIHAAMKARGYDVAGPQQVGHHRRGRCSCAVTG